MPAAPGQEGGPGSVLTALFREAGRPLLMPYATGGFPDPAGCRRIIDTYLAAGADIVELGIPFSDPVADGPVIQASSTRALQQGVRPATVLELAAQAAAAGGRIVLLSYLNTILALTPERFFAQCAASRVLGVVIPDLPVEEAAELQATAREWGVDVVLLAAPTSPDGRLERIARAASGFLYCVSVTGVTGMRDRLRADLPAFLGRLRRCTDLPLAVGFGISTPAQAAEVARVADGVIIGSRLVRLVQEAGDLTGGLERDADIARYLGEVRAAMAAAATR
ncbi:MAG: tryptophan synthase subunit alpha [Actinobacteria bacterium]|nr:tryptophan synthase subunit alpha [Actinomycetota bacterium]